jgi:hypothetical protein
MKNPFEVLRAKEEEILRLRNEIEALKIAAGLLRESGESPSKEKKAEYRQLLQMP